MTSRSKTRRPGSPATFSGASLPEILFLAFLSTLIPTGLLAESLPIVERSIAFHGGELYRASDTRLRICSRSGCFQLRAHVEGGLYDLTAAGQVRDSEMKVRTTNDTVERWRDGERVEVLEENAQTLRDFVMARIYFPFLPFRLGDPSARQEDLGLEEWDGRRLHKVGVTFAPGSSTDAEDEYLYWFDPSSGRLEQLAYSFQGNPGGLRLRRGHNYRRVGGILFFDQENLGVEGDGLDVGQINPKFVETMRKVSDVRLEGIEVRHLGDAP